MLVMNRSQSDLEKQQAAMWSANEKQQQINPTDSQKTGASSQNRYAGVGGATSSPFSRNQTIGLSMTGKEMVRQQEEARRKGTRRRRSNKNTRIQEARSKKEQKNEKNEEYDRFCR